MGKPAHDQGPSEDGQLILLGAATYDGAIERVGGRRVEATSPVSGRDLHVALYEAPPFDLHVAPADVACLTINLSNAPVLARIASTCRARYRGRRYSLFFTPERSDAHWTTSQSSRYLNIYFRDRLLDRLTVAPDALLRSGQPVLDGHVGRIKPLVDALVLSISQDEPFADDASLGLARLIVAELARTPTRNTAALKGPVLSRVQQHIGARMSETIHVSDLAALVGLSVRRFALRFRAAMGCAPHRYILRQRIDAAIRLLQDGELSIAAVAVECGFSSQQHMTTAMRQLAGVTPLCVRDRARRIAGANRLAVSRAASEPIAAGG